MSRRSDPLTESTGTLSVELDDDADEQPRKPSTIICCMHGRLCEQATSSGRPASSSYRRSRSPTTGRATRRRSPRSSRSRTLSEENEADDELEQNSKWAPISRRHLDEDQPSKEWLNNKEHAMLQEVYLGATSAEQAERALTQRTAFKLYHELPNWDWPSAVDFYALPQELPIKAVYLTSRGCYRHYPIVEQKTEGESKSALFRRKIYVDYGSPDAPRFTTLSALVLSYKIYSERHTNTFGQEPDIDVFPWWLENGVENNYEYIALN